jgi:endoglucanase
MIIPFNYILRLMPQKKFLPPEFLLDLLSARSPSGYEQQAHAVLDKHLKPAADHYQSDPMGNRIARICPNNEPTLMLAGHMDELGLIIRYVDDKGFLYFDTIGGHDLSIISGRRVVIQTQKGIVHGVTGKRAIHLMSPEDRKRVPSLHELWIDIGASSKKEALSKVAIGDAAVYDHGFSMLSGTLATARAFDDKAGCYVVCETLRRLSSQKSKLKACVVSVATCQEEIGTRGAITSAFSVNPHFAIAVDVGHATDHPDCNPKKFGEFKLGGGPIISRGPNISPLVFSKLIQCAKTSKIPFQVEAEARPTGTDARSIQIAQKGVATGLISIPLRYMHTPSEIIDLKDLEHTIKLLCKFAQSIKDCNNHF